MSIRSLTEFPQQNAAEEELFCSWMACPRKFFKPFNNREVSVWLQNFANDPQQLLRYYVLLRTYMYLQNVIVNRVNLHKCRTKDIFRPRLSTVVTFPIICKFLLKDYLPSWLLDYKCKLKTMVQSNKMYINYLQLWQQFKKCNFVQTQIKEKQQGPKLADS